MGLYYGDDFTMSELFSITSDYRIGTGRTSNSTRSILLVPLRRVSACLLADRFQGRESTSLVKQVCSGCDSRSVLWDYAHPARTTLGNFSKSLPLVGALEFPTDNTFQLVQTGTPSDGSRWSNVNLVSKGPAPCPLKTA